MCEIKIEGVCVKLVFLTILSCMSCSFARECCPPNTFLIENSRMCSDNISSFNLNCTDGALLLNPSVDKDDSFMLESNTSLIIFNETKIPDNEFCLGKIQRNGTENSVALICFSNKWWESVSVPSIFRILMLISTIFLVITLYIYLVLPNLKDLQGKCVLAFICCLIASYVTLFVVQTFPESSDIACIIQATSLYFFLSATFFWNNIITYNIWKAIRNISHKATEHCRGIIYVLWGFGVPLLMVIASVILEHLPNGNHIRPQFGQTNCWFKGKVETWSYFYGPISVLLLLNTLMFLQSTWTLWKSYRASNICKLRSLRYKCLMYLKLFLLMGISWVFEVVSYAVGSDGKTKYIWLIMDCLNSAQGVIIFLILVVFRQKVRLGLLKKKLFGINWPQSWANEEILESSTPSLAEEFELGGQKSKMIDESHK